MSDEYRFGGLGLRGWQDEGLRASGDLRVLVVPAVFKGQKQDGVMTHLQARLSEIEQVINEFHRENSFRPPGDPHEFRMRFDVLGRSPGLDAAIPLVLPGEVDEYWRRGFVKAGVRLTRSVHQRSHLIVLSGSDSFSLSLKPGDGSPLPVREIHGTCPAVVIELKPRGGRVTFANEGFGLVLDSKGLEQELVVDLGVASFDAGPGAVGSVVAKVRDHFRNQLALALPLGVDLAPDVRVEALRRADGGLERLLIALAAPDGWVIKRRMVIGAPPGIMRGPDFPLSEGSAMIPANQRIRFAEYWEIVLRLAEAANLREGDVFGLDSDRWVGDDVRVDYEWLGGDVAPASISVSFDLSDEVAAKGAAATLTSSGLAGFTSDGIRSIEGSNFHRNDHRTPKDGGGFINAVNQILIKELVNANVDVREVLSRYQYTVIAIPNLPGVSQPDASESFRAINKAHALWTALGPGGELLDPVPARTVWTVLFVAPAPTQMGPTVAIDASASTFIHETGHALGLPDLYAKIGFRKDLTYLENWSPMDNHGPLPHHCAQHKLVLGWLPPARVITRSRKTSAAGSCDVWLAPVELWDDDVSAQLDAWAALDGPQVEVAQMFRLELGGDGHQAVVVEARCGGGAFGTSTPDGLLVTNGLQPDAQQRIIVDGLFRREIQELAVVAAGASADLGTVPALPAGGVTVRSVEARTVSGAGGRSGMAHRVVVEWQEASGVDLALTPGERAWDSPDVWVDWPGDGPTAYPDGQPTDQGDTVRVPTRGAVVHQAVARVHNRGTADATNVVVQFDSSSPPTTGDGNWAPRTTGVVPVVSAGSYAEVRADFEVHAGDSAHFCLRATIQDHGVAGGGSADIDQNNDQAQKNVTRVEVLRSSPYRPVELQVEVTNAGPVDENAFLIPSGWGAGSYLTVKQPEIVVPAGGSAIFDVVVDLDADEVDHGERQDFSTHIQVWRRTDHASEPWGGCTFLVQPRQASECRAAVSEWLQGKHLPVHGNVPGATGGWVSVEAYLATTNGPTTRFTRCDVNHQGDWSGAVIANDASLAEVRAHFEGNQFLGAATSDLIRVRPSEIA